MINRYTIAAAVFAASMAASFWAGWEFRDRSADVTVAERDTKDAQAATQVITEARETDHASQRTATATEEQRVHDMTAHETTFQAIDQEVFRYAQQHATAPDPSPVPSMPGDSSCDRGSADADFLRIWRASNAGTANAEPGHPASTDGARAEGSSATRER